MVGGGWREYLSLPLMERLGADRELSLEWRAQLPAEAV